MSASRATFSPALLPSDGPQLVSSIPIMRGERKSSSICCALPGRRYPLQVPCRASSGRRLAARRFPNDGLRIVSAGEPSRVRSRPSSQARTRPLSFRLEPNSTNLPNLLTPTKALRRNSAS